MANMGTLFIISAPSGGGKTSLVNAILQRDPNVKVSISHTTRASRVGEKTGVNYFFVDENEFMQYQQQGVFLESARVFNHWYGTSKKWVLDQLSAGLDVILEIDWQGARRVKELMECVSIFILPPSKEALYDRLQSRQQDSPDVISTRMAKASQEISHYPEYDYVVINDKFEVVLDDLLTIIKSQRMKTAAQQLRYAELLASLVE
jgi:guanylate kinase